MTTHKRPVQYQQRMPARGYYGSSPQYGYYPRHPYAVPKKQIWPLLISLLGIALLIFSFISVPLIDPKLMDLAKTNPTDELAGVAFCDGICEVDGEIVGTNKYLVVGTAADLIDMTELENVKQVKFLGMLD
ncbi:MAG: hypothetical protein GOU99_01555 [Candidatus Altiarchaeota archaeon]|nr:hypothetical protein [Candidatus Altiarchaeota archaeon]